MLNILKKSIISLSLVGLTLTTNVYPLWGAKTSLTKQAMYASKRLVKQPLKKLKKFSKYPLIGSLIVSLITITFIANPMNKLKDEAIKKLPDKGALGVIKWLIQTKENNEEDRLKNIGVNELSVKIDFANKNNFAPGSIDPEILKLKNKIDKWRIDPVNNSGLPMFTILDGPSHIGKSKSAVAIANELGAKKFFQIVASNFQGGIVGDTQRNIIAMFNRAKAIATNEHPCVVIVDELDFVIKKDDKYASTALGAFHQVMDGMENGNYKNVYLIATTNHWPEIENDQPTMASRFTKVGGVILMKNPSPEARYKFLKEEGAKNKIDFQENELKKLVSNTEGCNLAKLLCIITKIKDEIEAQKPAENNNLNQAININLQVPKKNILQQGKDIFKPVISIFTKKETNKPKLVKISDFNIKLDDLIIKSTGKKDLEENLESNM